jgi:hypothetical protein
MDEQPSIVLCRPRVRTWEHAVLAAGSWGYSKSVAASLRLLEATRTEPIFERMRAVEGIIARRTCPLAPFRNLRVLIDGSDDGVKLLKTQCADKLDGTLAAIVERWSSVVEAAYEQHGRERLMKAASEFCPGIRPERAETLALWYQVDIEIYQSSNIDGLLNDIGRFNRWPPCARAELAVMKYE